MNDDDDDDEQLIRFIVTVDSENMFMKETLFLSHADSIPDYRLYLPIRNETYDVFDPKLHPVDTTILQLRLIASERSGIPLSAFCLIHETHHELLDHVRLSQYDIGQ